MNSGSQSSSYKGTPSASTAPESTEPTQCTEDTSQRRDCLREERVVSSRITVPPELYTTGNELAVSTSDMHRLRSVMLQNQAELVTGLSGSSTWDTTRPQVNIASESFTCTILASNDLNCSTNTAQDNLVDYYCEEGEELHMTGVEASSTAETTEIVIWEISIMQQTSCQFTI